MTVRQSDAHAIPALRALGWAGLLLGFALGGFFDGILLHQILQWHHLLSLVTRPPFQDIRVQILADGLFHLLMYVIALAGLWKLWKGRHGFGAPGGDRLLLANAAIGFGAWHMIDGVLSHWVLGIHRIRLDSDNVLFWDVLWFVVFGVAVAALGWWLRRRGTCGHWTWLTRAGRPCSTGMGLSWSAIRCWRWAAWPGPRLQKRKNPPGPKSGGSFFHCTACAAKAARQPVY